MGFAKSGVVRRRGLRKLLGDIVLVAGLLLDDETPPKTAIVVDAATGRALATFHCPVGLEDLELSTDGQRLICVGMADTDENGKLIHGGSLFLVDATTGKGMAGFVGDDVCDVGPVALSRDGRRLAACGAGVVKVWDVEKILRDSANTR